MEREVIVTGENSRHFPVSTICIPAIKEVVCRWGAKCFHDIHFSETFTPFGGSPQPIPNGACLQGLPVITNFDLKFDRQVDTCCRVLVSYTIVAIVIDFATGTPIGVIQENVVNLPLQIPTFPVPGPLCFGPVIHEDAFVIQFPRVFSATITTINGVNTAVFRVEKIFGCFKSQLAIICQLDCAPDEPACTPPMPTPPTSPFCPEFTTPTVCFEFCVDVEGTSPYNCDQCPPPQTITEPTIP